MPQGVEDCRQALGAAVALRSHRGLDQTAAEPHCAHKWLDGVLLNVGSCPNAAVRPRTANVRNESTADSRLVGLLCPLWVGSRPSRLVSLGRCKVPLVRSAIVKGYQMPAAVGRYRRGRRNGRTGLGWRVTAIVKGYQMPAAVGRYRRGRRNGRTGLGWRVTAVGGRRLISLGGGNRGRGTGGGAVKIGYGDLKGARWGRARWKRVREGMVLGW